MRDFLDSITNRDYAIALWLVATLAFALRSRVVREPFFAVLKAATQRQILLVVIFMLVWTGLATFLVARLEFWSSGQIKATVYWFLFVALPTLRTVVDASRDQRLLFKPIKDSIKLSAFFEFFVNIYALPLFVEIIFTPFLAAIAWMSVIAERGERHERVKRCLGWLMMAIVVLLIAYQVHMIYIDPTHGLTQSNFRALVLPIYYTAAYIPCMFLIKVFVAYQEVFGRLRFVVQDKSLIPYAKRVLIIGFGMNVQGLSKWFRHSWDEPLVSKDQIDALVCDVKRESKS